ncbi:MAG: UvrD-helicase domain-containing protein [Burkholderiales bacterium]
MTDRDDPLARDAAHREAALDTRRSFLVQAPAGSGKTELLIQRYLALLATVSSPQRVVAVTFTRKAANEMRERVVAALREAREGTPVAGPHRALTRRLAEAALSHADAKGWSVLDYPAQLAIGTIDSLCGRIARQAPLSSGLTSSPRPVDDARGLHLEAARATLASADPASPAWRTLLARLDNDAEMTVRYLAKLLERRDQWLRHLGKRDAATWRAELEELLTREIEAELSVVRSALVPWLEPLIVECAKLAARYLASEGDALNAWLAYAAAQGALPPATAEHVGVWRALAEWLMVKNEPRLRTVMDRRQGIPPKSIDRGRPVEARDRMLAALQMQSGVAETLHVARVLPSPAYEDDAWAAIEALLEILPGAAAQLLVVFATRGTCDYAQYTLAALQALGDADAPSDLLMRLDLAIDHLLVDEFQDTSEAQYQLIGKLTSGWTQDDGRTLFAVGDPMQSIYRFRDAEVRLFLESREDARIGHVPVRFIDLARNFRSQGHIVSWVNRVFPGVLAGHNDPWSGAVAFAPAAASKAEGEEGPPTLDLALDHHDEARLVVARVQHAIAHTTGDIAILVRARADLVRILPALRAADVGFAAVELDALADRQAVQDLVSLTHALVQPADRLAALAVLRAPWCGLTLPDLVALASRLDNRGLPALCASADAIAGCTDDGASRWRALAATLAPAFAEHATGSLADRVRGTWLALGGPACAPEAIDLAAADDYFSLLRAYESAGDIPDWQGFVDELGRRFATSTQDVFARVKVMTLFKAKGLEFETVVIPGLADAKGGDDNELLRWRARKGGLLIATARARGGAKDPVYEYLRWLASAELDHELGRILYVGTTRACRRLHLVAVAKVDEHGDWKAPSSKTPLGKLWERLAQDRGAPPEVSAPPDEQSVPAPPLRRLSSAFALPPLREGVTSPFGTPEPTPPPPFEWAHPAAAAVGTVSHRVLAQFAREPVERFDDARLEAAMPRIRNDLIGEGVDADDLSQALRDVASVVRAVRDDPRGRWLFDATHAEAVSEWPLAGVDEGSIVHVTLDRSFVADGVRWIVDFKTGRHEGGSPDAFLAREVERYRGQLERYARVVSAIDARPIRLALYYPLVAGGWREWAFARWDAQPSGTQASLF